MRGIPWGAVPQFYKYPQLPPCSASGPLSVQDQEKKLGTAEHI